MRLIRRIFNFFGYDFLIYKRNNTAYFIVPEHIVNIEVEGYSGGGGGSDYQWTTYKDNSNVDS